MDFLVHGLCAFGVRERQVGLLPWVGQQIKQCAIGVEQVFILSHRDPSAPLAKEASRNRWQVRLQEFLRKAEPIEWVIRVRLDRDPCQFAQGGGQVDRSAELIQRMMGSEVSWPVDDQRRANATFVDAPFATFEACIPAKTVRPIVVEVHDDRLIAKPQLIECREQTTDVLIEIFYHGNGRPRGRFVFFFSRASLMPHLEIAAFDPIHERIGDLHR